MANKGQTLVETVVTLLLMTVGAMIAIPLLDGVVRSAALRGVTSRVRCQMLRARAEAMRTGHSTALVFEPGPGLGWRCTVVMDGDGDGVRREDIESGRDVRLEAVFQMDENKSGLGILSNVRVPDPGGQGWLGGDLGDPVRAGAGNIMTFTSEGTSSSGTLYFSDGQSKMRALRVFGVTGRIRGLAWQAEWERWRVAGL